MGPQDGVDYALRSLAHIYGTTSATTTCRPPFLGYGDAWDDLVALAQELGLDDRVEFTGRVSDADVALPSLDRRRLSRPRPEEPAQRRLDDEQDRRVHGDVAPGRLLRPDRGPRRRAGRRSTRTRTTSASSPASLPSCSTTRIAGPAWARWGGCASSRSCPGSTRAVPCSAHTRRCSRAAARCAAHARRSRLAWARNWLLEASS